MIEVYKFGGASVKDAEAVRNVSEILRKAPKNPRVVVVSAMGKMTNAFEVLHQKRMQAADFSSELNEIIAFHDEIATELGLTEDQLAPYHRQLGLLREEMTRTPSSFYDLEYDRLIPFGELLSTSLIAGFLKSSGITSEWFDVRHVIRTNNTHRNAEVNWDRSERQAKTLRDHLTETPNMQVVTQGFIGLSELGNSTTLGREGSDYTAAILAYLLDAQDVTIWKDVPGMLNADPKWFNNTVKIEQISYREAIELSYYGASVIHPKTIQPLQNKGIPLYVKSFLDPATKGTVIHSSTARDHLVPMYIFKPNQVLVSIASKDFSFIVEENLGEIFSLIAQSGLHVNVMQNSAISFSICVDDDDERLRRCRELLSSKYDVKFNKDLELLTIRHYDAQTVNQLTTGKETLLEQKSRQTVRLVLRPDLQKEA